MQAIIKVRYCSRFVLLILICYIHLKYKFFSNLVNLWILLKCRLFNKGAIVTENYIFQLQGLFYHFMVTLELFSISFLLPLLKFPPFPLKFGTGSCMVIFDSELSSWNLNSVLRLSTPQWFKKNIIQSHRFFLTTLHSW